MELLDSEAVGEISELLGKPIDDMGGGISGFIYDMGDNKSLIFGYSSGGLGYDYWDDEKSISIESGECREMSNAKEQTSFIKFILNKLSK